MISPKEKAAELIDEFTFKCTECDYLYKAKQCALILCNEMLGHMGAGKGYEFWTEVKKEIIKL